MMLQRIEKWIGEDFRKDIIFEQSYSLKDFGSDYHAYKGNAYGLANTLNQTAIFKPKMKNRHLNNLWYCGQLTVPGPGMPPSIISGIIAGSEVQKQMKKESKQVRAELRIKSGAPSMKYITVKLSIYSSSPAGNCHVQWVGEIKHVEHLGSLLTFNSSVHTNYEHSLHRSLRS